MRSACSACSRYRHRANEGTQHSSGFKKNEEDANEEAEAKLVEIKDAGSKKGDKVVEDLIYALVNVNPEVPEKIVAKS